MDDKPFYILAKYDLRFSEFAYPRHIKKECASGHTLVIVIKAHAFSGEAEGLAGKTCKAKIKFGDLLLLLGSYVSCYVKAVIKIKSVGLFCIFVPLADIYSLYLISEGSVKAQAYTSYSGKKVYGLKNSFFVLKLPVI